MSKRNIFPVHFRSLLLALMALLIAPSTNLVSSCAFGQNVTEIQQTQQALLAELYAVQTQIAQAEQSQINQSPAPVAVAPVAAVVPVDNPAYVRASLGISLVNVPAGSFLMGSKNATEAEKPSHDVQLDGFYIFETEVTNKQYQACVEAGVCSVPQSLSSSTRPNYYTDPIFNTFPVINVNWEQARDFCIWIGGSLPTEAQWEKAARGKNGSPYPWGTDLDWNNKEANINALDTARVGAYPRDLSPYGALDMGGNVSEWALDWYSADYYKASPAENPSGPENGSIKVVRGGNYAIDYTKVYIRYWTDMENDTVDSYYDNVGFRCVTSTY